MFFVVIGWVLFNFTDFGQLPVVLKQMFSYHSTNWLEMLMTDTSVLYGAVFLPLGLVWMLPLPRRFRQNDSAGMLALSNFFHLALLVVCIIFIVSAQYNPFIYFRF